MLVKTLYTGAKVTDDQYFYVDDDSMDSRSIAVVRASGCQCQSLKSHRFDSSNLRHTVQMYWNLRGSR